MVFQVSQWELLASENKMDLDSAVEILKPMVKMSNVKNQTHIDLTLAPIEEIEKYQEAMVVIKQAVLQKAISQKDLNSRLGI